MKELLKSPKAFQMFFKNKLPGGRRGSGLGLGVGVELGLDFLKQLSCILLMNTSEEGERSERREDKGESDGRGGRERIGLSEEKNGILEGFDVIQLNLQVKVKTFTLASTSNLLSQLLLLASDPNL
jgi:hypothetical protein